MSPRLRADHTRITELESWNARQDRIDNGCICPELALACGVTVAEIHDHTSHQERMEWMAYENAVGPLASPGTRHG